MPSAKQDKLSYNPTIDGLRAVAVLAVLVFHTSILFHDKAIATGLFLGVDIFFVISGYLMAAIVRPQVHAAAFSFWRFADKRLRRLLPALLLVCAATAIMAYWWLYPEALVRFSEQLFSAVFFFSNIDYWRQEDAYFAFESEMLPLLHTWSLGVEMGFYALIALLALLVPRFIYLLALLCGLSAFVWLGYGDVAGNARFYLLPFRLWEFVIGMAVVYLPTMRIKWGGLLSVCALIGLCSCFYWYEEYYYHPTLKTAPILIATAAIIWLSRCGVKNLLLDNHYATGVGKMSYSVYLWHWPLLLFAKYYALTPLSRAEVCLVVLGVIVVSYCSWRWVEEPCRNRNKPKATRFYAGAGFVILALCAYTFSIQQSKGFPNRLPEIAKQAESLESQWMKLEQGAEPCLNRAVEDMCVFGDAPYWLAVGDSTVGSLLPELHDRLNQEGVGLKVLANEGCRLEIDAIGEDSCDAHNREWQRYLEQLSEPHTLFVRAEDTLATTAFLKRLHENGHRVILFEKAPKFLQHVVHVGMKQLLRGGRVDVQTQRGEREFEQMAKTAGVGYFDAAEVMCSYTMCHASDPHGIFYTDKTHFSRYGAQRVVDSLLQSFPPRF